VVSNVYNSFRRQIGNNDRNQDETLDRLNARFMRLASRHAAKGQLSSTARIDPVHQQSIRSNFSKNVDISSFSSSFEYEEEV